MFLMMMMKIKTQKLNKKTKLRMAIEWWNKDENKKNTYRVLTSTTNFLHTSLFLMIA